ncbi:MAG: LicD family protein, partial [Calditrichaceae bacterium]
MGGTKKLVGTTAEKAIKLLHTAADILEEAGIPYILEAGTLLGIVRENRLLPWDTDLDITITRAYEKQLKAVRSKFWDAGYRTRMRKFKRDVDFFKKGTNRILRVQTRKFYFLKDFSLLDIFIKDPVDDEYYWTVSEERPVLKSVPKRFYDEITQIEFNGRKYWVPKDYEDYLECHYGDWRTPVKEWNSRTSDLSVKKILD